MTKYLFPKIESSAPGIPNPLFAGDNTLMLFGDGKKMAQEIVRALKDS